MKTIWHISDTHSYHRLLKVPDNIDIVVHSGDFSNYYNVYKNEPEAKDFLQWYANLPIKHKILIAGNHDALPALDNKSFRQLCNDLNIIYLENESIEIEGINIWGSPYTPTFGNWYFMKDRGKLDKIWRQIPDNTDIVVVHGPPKGILDVSINVNKGVDLCGCGSLRSHILNRVKPKLMLFGHIHNVDYVINAGTLQLSVHPTMFSNGSVVTDRKFGVLTSNGNILKI